MPLQDWQKKGRKSSWLQYVYWQWWPINVASAVSILTKEESLLSPDEDAILGGCVGGAGYIWAVAAAISRKTPRSRQKDCCDVAD